jgi:hypothetical protein
MSDEMAEGLRGARRDKSNRVIAEDAVIVGESLVRALVADLEAAFECLMDDAAEKDKQCRGKIAIADALLALEYAEAALFLRGIAHVQEPRGGAEIGQDAAGPLRFRCALGLARLHPITELLLDSDKPARAGAARALGASGSLAAIPLLRFKARLGDREGIERILAEGARRSARGGAPGNCHAAVARRYRLLDRAGGSK